MKDKSEAILKKLSEIEKRMEDLESYVYNLDDFLPARSLIEKAMNFIEKKEKVSAPDLEKRFRITNLRAAKLIELFINYGMLSSEVDADGFRTVKKEIFKTFDEPSYPIEYGEDDPYLPKAIELIQNFDKASASLLQRKFKIGYARAARLLEFLEEKGYVGPAIGEKPREILKK